jgi:hypothetical protein
VVGRARQMKYNIPNTHIHPWGGEIKTDEIQYT